MKLTVPTTNEEYADLAEMSEAGRAKSVTVDREVFMRLMNSYSLLFDAADRNGVEIQEGVEDE